MIEKKLAHGIAIAIYGKNNPNLIREGTTNKSSTNNKLTSKDPKNCK